MVEATTRRERLRAETLREITATARRALVAEGWDGLSLRAIARAVGLSAPAIYRYYPSREDLVAALVTELKRELVTTMEAARDAEPADDIPARLLAVSRAFRGWAVRNRAEFTLLFASPVAGLERPPAADATGDRIGTVFGELVTQLYLTRPFPVPADDEIDPALREQLAEWCAAFPVPLPLGVSQVFLSCWIRLFGTVSLEVFGHLGFALDDVGPMYEAELASLAALLGMSGSAHPPGTDR